jgi:hypothetical protein
VIWGLKISTRPRHAVSLEHRPRLATSKGPRSFGEPRPGRAAASDRRLDTTGPRTTLRHYFTFL